MVQNGYYEEIEVSVLGGIVSVRYINRGVLEEDRFVIFEKINSGYLRDVINVFIVCIFGCLFFSFVLREFFCSVKYLFKSKCDVIIKQFSSIGYSFTLSVFWYENLLKF